MIVLLFIVTILLVGQRKNSRNLATRPRNGKIVWSSLGEFANEFAKELFTFPFVGSDCLGWKEGCRLVFIILTRILQLQSKTSFIHRE
jgi:hypothetical protein